MWLFVAVLASLMGAVICRAPVVTPYGNFSTDPLSAEDQERFDRNAKTGRTNYPPGFKFMYFSQSGGTSVGYKPSENYIRVVGSPLTSYHTLTAATQALRDLMRHTPEYIFNRVAQSPGGAGVFTAKEKITVFPQFAVYADREECRGRCDGDCYITCTGDGRKTENLAGATAALALVVEDNVICTDDDPYFNRDNILVHEFAHMVGKEGQTAADHAQNEANYNNAKSQKLWGLHTYAMSNQAEYFAEATGAFFLVNLQSGGMTSCSYGECTSMADARNLIKSRDRNLYDFLVHIWNDGNEAQTSDLQICYG